MGLGMELQHSHNRNKGGPQSNRQDCAYSDPGGNEITFVQDKDEMFPALLLFEVGFHMRGASAHGVPGIQNLNNNIWGVNHLKNNKKKSNRSKGLCRKQDNCTCQRKTSHVWNCIINLKTLYPSQTATSPQTSEVQTNTHWCSTVSSPKPPPNSAWTAERLLPVLMHQGQQTLHPNEKSKVLQHTNPQCSPSTQQQLPSTIS